MHGLLVGHSFVRRLRRAYSPVHRDISFEERNCAEARQLSNALKWNNCVNYVYTLSHNINILEDLPRGYCARCDFLIINMGSNDLANLKKVDFNGVRMFAENYFTWAKNTGARNCLFIGILKRTGRLRCTREVFNKNRQFF